MAEKLAAFINTAWDWSERKDVPVEIWRSEVGDWYITLRLKDGKGWFNGSLAYFDPKLANNGKPRETEDEYRDRILSELSKTAQKARAARIKQFNGLSQMKAKAA
jgi:hypothetical protein